MSLSDPGWQNKTLVLLPRAACHFGYRPGPRLSQAEKFTASLPAFVSNPVLGIALTSNSAGGEENGARKWCRCAGIRLAAENGVAVRRDKAPFFSGCNSRPATFAPAGSNRSGAAGNEIAEAFAAKERQVVPRASRP